MRWSAGLLWVMLILGIVAVSISRYLEVEHGIVISPIIIFVPLLVACLSVWIRRDRSRNLRLKRRASPQKGFDDSDRRKQ